MKELDEQGGNRSESKDMHLLSVSLLDVTGIPLKQKEDDSKNVYLYLLQQEKQEERMSFLQKLLCNSWSSSLSVESVSPVSSTTFLFLSVSVIFHYQDQAGKEKCGHNMSSCSQENLERHEQEHKRVSHDSCPLVFSSSFSSLLFLLFFVFTDVSSSDASSSFSSQVIPLENGWLLILQLMLSSLFAEDTKVSKTRMSKVREA